MKHTVQNSNKTTITNTIQGHKDSDIRKSQNLSAAHYLVDSLCIESLEHSVVKLSFLRQAI